MLLRDSSTENNLAMLDLELRTECEIFLRFELETQQLKIVADKQILALCNWNIFLDFAGWQIIFLMQVQ